MAELSTLCFSLIQFSCINYVYLYKTIISCCPLSAKHVEEQGVLERCSFEQGLCSWAESDVDTPGVEWTHHKGEEAWPERGPPRDHTENSDAGMSLRVLMILSLSLQRFDLN